jgi:hypothetical protein
MPLQITWFAAPATGSPHDFRNGCLFGAQASGPHRRTVGGEKARKCRSSSERLKGFEPSTFCMASRTCGADSRGICLQTGGFCEGCADGLPRDSPGVHGGLGSEWVVTASYSLGRIGPLGDRVALQAGVLGGEVSDVHGRARLRELNNEPPVWSRTSDSSSGCMYMPGCSSVCVGDGARSTGQKSEEPLTSDRASSVPEKTTSSPSPVTTRIATRWPRDWSKTSTRPATSPRSIGADSSPSAGRRKGRSGGTMSRFGCCRSADRPRSDGRSAHISRRRSRWRPTLHRRRRREPTPSRLSRCDHSHVGT